MDQQTEPQPQDELEQLEELVGQAQRKELDLGPVSLADLSRRLRERLDEAGEGVDLLWGAESLEQLSRLLELKLGRGGEELAGGAPAGLEEGGPDPQARIEEYRIFKAAAGALLADSNAGPKAFLRVLGLPLEPRADLHLSPETLALAFGELLAKLPETDELQFTLPRYSVEEKVAWLRRLLSERSPLAFDEVFASSADRLEAVAIFLGLLELIWTREASCSQDGPDSPIWVERADGG